MSKLSERTTHFPLLFSSLKVIDLGTPYPNLTVLTLSLPSGYSAVPSPCHPPLHSFPSCFTPLPHIHTHGQRRPCRKITLSLSERRGFFVLLQRTKGSFVYKKDFQLVLARGISPSIQLERERKCVCVCVCVTHTHTEGSGQVHCGKSSLTERGAGSCRAEIGSWSASRCQVCQKLLLGSEKQQQDPAFL